MPSRLVSRLCLVPEFGVLKFTVAFRLYLVIIVQPLTNQAQKVHLAKYNQTVQLVFDFIHI
jgi:hypothetical protein